MIFAMGENGSLAAENMLWVERPELIGPVDVLGDERRRALRARTTPRGRQTREEQDVPQAQRGQAAPHELDRGAAAPLQLEGRGPLRARGAGHAEEQRREEQRHGPRADE